MDFGAVAPGLGLAAFKGPEDYTSAYAALRLAASVKHPKGRVPARGTSTLPLSGKEPPSHVSGAPGSCTGSYSTKAVSGTKLCTGKCRITILSPFDHGGSLMGITTGANRSACQLNPWIGSTYVAVCTDF